jgi:protocatechuate 3,4-dioxygenase beta subunit
MKYFDTSRRDFLGKSATVIVGTALLSSQFTLGNVLSQNPFEGYNPYAETKNDLRTGLIYLNNVKVSGKIFLTDGTQPAANANIEVWHLSPGSKQYKNRGKFSADENGNYQFVTDFPNRKEGKKPRIYFKISSGDAITYTELLLDRHQAYINETHWANNQLLGDAMLPSFRETMQGKEIQFNITI